MISAKQRSAEKAGFQYLEVPLACGETSKQWICPRNGGALSVERAVLSHFEQEGWRGYWGEGGLLLNLIKCMSFRQLPPFHRRTFVEAIFAQNIAFDEEKVPVPVLLETMARASSAQIQQNFALMIDPGPFTYQLGPMTTTSSGSITEYFPGLALWMLQELFEVAGTDRLIEIARLFARDPYQFRRGWPDITMWRDGALRFVEVKAPGDSLGASQKTIAAEFATPLGLDFALAAVISH